MAKCQRHHGKFHQQSFLVPKSNGKGLKVTKECDYIIGYRLQDGKGNKQALLCKDVPFNSPIPIGYVVL